MFFYESDEEKNSGSRPDSGTSAGRGGANIVNPFEMGGKKNQLSFSQPAQSPTQCNSDAAARMEKIRKAEEQRRKQRRSSAGMIFTSDSEAAVSHMSNGKTNSFIKKKKSETDVLGTQGDVSAGKDPLTRKESTIGNIDFSDLLPSGKEGIVIVNTKKSSGDKQKEELLARGIAPIFDFSEEPVEEAPMPEETKAPKPALHSSKTTHNPIKSGQAFDMIPQSSESETPPPKAVQKAEAEGNNEPTRTIESNMASMNVKEGERDSSPAAEKEQKARESTTEIPKYPFLENKALSKPKLKEVAKLKDAGKKDMTKGSSSSPATRAKAYEGVDLSDTLKFVNNPAPKGVKILCRITRDKKGVEKGMYPTYYLHLEKENREREFLLAARKRKRSKTSNYVISTDPLDLSRESDNFCGKLRSNFMGTHFSVYDNGVNPKKVTIKNPTAKSRRELASISYDTNLLGFKGPRKMHCLIPGLNNDESPIVWRPRAEKETLLETFKAGNFETGRILALKNKAPVWNDDIQSFVLNFHGRVTVASVKNFQLIHENDPDYVLLQFGKVGDDAFTMDYQFPMTAIQAFSIVLSSFDGKIACE
eukprot:Nk52_evm19s239 gene=Nk52_evmTU19s239